MYLGEVFTGLIVDSLIVSDGGEKCSCGWKENRGLEFLYRWCCCCWKVVDGNEGLGEEEREGSPREFSEAASSNGDIDLQREREREGGWKERIMCVKE